MTNEERDIITRFIERVSGAQGATGFAQGGQGGGQPLPPVDPEADHLIGDLFAKYPEARYRLTQTAFVQEQALAQATATVQRLQQELAQAHQAAAAAPQQQQSSGGGFFSGLFGGSRQAAPPPQPAPVWNQGAAPQPQYAPAPPQYAAGYQPGMLGGGGTGFLGGALRTAAGVAGGVVLGNALMNLFEGHGGGGGSGATFAPESGASPWGSPPAAGDAGSSGYVDQGSWTPDASGGGTASGTAGGGGWTDASAQPDQGGGGWSDAPPANDSWSDAGGGGGGGTGGGGGGWDDSSS